MGKDSPARTHRLERPVNPPRDPLPGEFPPASWWGNPNRGPYDTWNGLTKAQWQARMPAPVVPPPAPPPADRHKGMHIRPPRPGDREGDIIWVPDTVAAGTSSAGRGTAEGAAAPIVTGVPPQVTLPPRPQVPAPGNMPNSWMPLSQRTELKVRRGKGQRI
jgi:hypothetical protein